MNSPVVKFVLLSFIAFLSFVSSARAATFTVNSAADNEANGCAVGVCTLREAITAANSNGEDDTIVFDGSVFAAPQKINLNGARLEINAGQNLTIAGMGASKLTISAGNLSGIFYKTGAGTLIVSGITLNDGRTAQGGGLYNAQGTTNFNGVTFSFNRATDEGAAIYNFSGTVNLSNCSIEQNSNAVVVVRNRVGATMNIADSRISANAGGAEAIISNAGQMSVARSIINDNFGTAIINNSALIVSRTEIGKNINSLQGSNGGGALENSSVNASATISDTYIHDNQQTRSSGGGGGIANFDGTVTVASSTVSGNAAYITGGGIYSTGGSISLTNSTIFGNSTTAVASTYSDDQGGAGLYFRNTTATLTNSTIYKNDSARDTGGIKKIGTGETTLYNSIVTGNTARTVTLFGAQQNIPNLYGTFTSRSGNVIGTRTSFDGGTFSGDQANISPAQAGLAANLAFNGGFTPTVALGCCGVAVGGGRIVSQTGFPTPTVDQRGVPRVDGNGNPRNDSGAFQFADYLPTPSAPDLTDASDTGASQIDNLTNSRAPIFKITGALANAFITVFKNGGFLASGAANGDGEFTFTDSAPPANGAANYNAYQESGSFKSRDTAQTTVTYDTAAPTVLSIDDGDADNSVNVNTPLNYTVQFNEDIDSGTVSAADFDNAGTSNINVGAISETSAGVFSIAVTPTSGGTLRLRIPASADVRDAAGNKLAAPVQDDTIVTVVPANVPQIFVVNSLNDPGDGVCNASECTLREAITAAELTTAADTINVQITGDVFLQSDLPTITQSLTINGNSQSGFRVRGRSLNGLVRPFTINASTQVAVNINNLTVQDGNSDLGGGIYVQGGAVVTLANLTVAGNFLTRGAANTGGAGIAVRSSTLNIVNSQIESNEAQLGNGAGIRSDDSAVTITNSFIRNNSATNDTNPGEGEGGGIYARNGSLTITGSTITGNQTINANFRNGGGLHLTNVAARIENSVLINNKTGSGSSNGGDGGGVFASGGTLRMSNVTFYQNRARNGGALYLSAVDATLRNVTVGASAGNGNRATSGQGGGIYATDGATVRLANTIAANNVSGTTSSPSDFYAQNATVTLLTRNIVRSGVAGTGNTTNGAGTAEQIDPKFDTLACGQVCTFSIAADSPAVDAGTNSEALDTQNTAQPLTTDARGTGFARVRDGNNDGTATVDLGAFEYQPLTPTAASVSVGGRVSTPDGKGLRGALVTITDQNGDSRTAVTSAFGHYRFADVAAGQTYVLRVVSKRYQFAAQTVNLYAETNDLNFVGQN